MNKRGDDYGDWLYDREVDRKLDEKHDALAALRAENAKLKEDSEMLEWLAAHEARLTTLNECTIVLFWDGNQWDQAEARDCRAAIREAMKGD